MRSEMERCLPLFYFKHLVLLVLLVRVMFCSAHGYGNLEILSYLIMIIVSQRNNCLKVCYQF